MGNVQTHNSILLCNLLVHCIRHVNSNDMNGLVDVMLHQL